MQIITVMIEEREDGTHPVRVVRSDGLTAELAASGCRVAADVFDAETREAEIARRVAAALEEQSEGADDDPA